MAFWKKKKSSNLVRHQRTFSNFFLPTKKLLLFTFWTKCWLLLYRKNQSQYHLVFSVLLNTCFSERDFFSQHPFKCDPPPSLSHSPLPDNFSICLCFTLLLPCWVLLLCLFFFEALFLRAQAGLPHRPYFYSRCLAPPSKFWDYRSSETYLLLHLLWLLPATHMKQLSNKM